MKTAGLPEVCCSSEGVVEEMTKRVLKRSSHVAAPLLASVAVAILAGCRTEQPVRCVDENNHVVDPSFCQNQPKRGDPNYRPGIVPYRFYYGGGGGFAPGTIVSGGSLTPTPGVAYSTTARGGFGSSAGGADGDGAGGHGGGGE